MEKRAYQQRYWTCNGYDTGMDAIKCRFWNDALPTCRVVSRNYHVDTADDDDDGLDGIVDMDYILAKGALQPWMLLEYSSQCMQQLFSYHG